MHNFTTDTLSTPTQFQLLTLVLNVKTISWCSPNSENILKSKLKQNFNYSKRSKYWLHILICYIICYIYFSQDFPQNHKNVILTINTQTLLYTTQNFTNSLTCKSNAARFFGSTTAKSLSTLPQQVSLFPFPFQLLNNYSTYKHR